MRCFQWWMVSLSKLYWWLNIFKNSIFTCSFTMEMHILQVNENTVVSRAWLVEISSPAKNKYISNPFGMWILHFPTAAKVQIYILYIDISCFLPPILSSFPHAFNYLSERHACRFTSTSPHTRMFTVDTPSPPLITARLRSQQHPVNKSINHLRFSSTAWLKFMGPSSTKSQWMNAQGRPEG